MSGTFGCRDAVQQKKNKVYNCAKKHIRMTTSGSWSQEQQTTITIMALLAKAPDAGTSTQLLPPTSPGWNHWPRDPAEKEMCEHNTRERDRNSGVCMTVSTTELLVLKLFRHRSILSFSTLIRWGLIMIKQLRLYYANDKLLALYLRHVYSLPIKMILRATHFHYQHLL